MPTSMEKAAILEKISVLDNILQEAADLHFERSYYIPSSNMYVALCKGVILRFPMSSLSDAIPRGVSTASRQFNNRHVLKSMPKQLVDFAGYAIDPPEYDLEEWIDRNISLSDNEALEIIRQAAIGLYAVQKTGILHLGITPGSILHYGDGVWVLGDCSTLRENSRYSSNESEIFFEDPEAIRLELDQVKVEKGKCGVYSLEHQIFRLGMTLYIALTGEMNGILPTYADANSSYQQHILETVAQLIIGDKARYFLRRMIGERFQGQFSQEIPMENYRYRTLEAFLNEIDGDITLADRSLDGDSLNVTAVSSAGRRFNDGTTEQEKHPHYGTLIDLIQQHEHAVEQGNSARTGLWGTVERRKIESIASLRDKIKSYAQDATLMRYLDSKQQVEQAIARHNQTVGKDREILVAQMKEWAKPLEEGKRAFDNVDEMDDFFSCIYEIMYLWGPPLTRPTIENKGVTRYTAAQTAAKETWYHVHKPWRMGFVKKVGADALRIKDEGMRGEVTARIEQGQYRQLYNRVIGIATADENTSGNLQSILLAGKGFVKGNNLSYCDRWYQYIFSKDYVSRLVYLKIKFNEGLTPYTLESSLERDVRDTARRYKASLVVLALPADLKKPESQEHFEARFYS